MCCNVVHRRLHSKRDLNVKFVSFVFKLIKALFNVNRRFDPLHQTQINRFAEGKPNHTVMHFSKSNSLDSTTKHLLLVHFTRGRIIVRNYCIGCLIASIISWYCVRCSVYYINLIENQK